MFSKLLGGTWILWFAALYILAMGTALVFFWPKSHLLVDSLIALILIISAVYQAKKYKNQQYTIKRYEAKLVEEEKKRDEERIESTTSMYESAHKFFASCQQAVNTRLSKKRRKK